MSMKCLVCVEVNLFLVVLVREDQKKYMGKILTNLFDELNANLEGRPGLFSVLFS